MKKIIVALVLITTVKFASAMPAIPPGGGHVGGHFGGGFGGRTTIVVGGGFYSPYYSPFGYYGFGYPYPYGAVPYQPSKLDMQIMDIKNDYADKIASVKLDKSLSGKERRMQVREFKRERDRDVLEARRNYYKLK